MTMLSKTMPLAPAPTGVRALERFVSGRRVNRFADDASSFAISEGLEARIGSRRVLIRGLQHGFDALMQLDDGLALMNDRLIRMREVALTALNGTIERSVRLGPLLAAFWGARSDLNDVAWRTRLGSTHQTLQTGISVPLLMDPSGRASSVVTLNVPSTWGRTMVGDSGRHLDQAWIGIESFIRDAMTTIDSGINDVNRARSLIGSMQNRLAHAMSVNEQTEYNEYASHQGLVGVNLGHEGVKVVIASLKRGHAVTLMRMVRDLDTAAVQRLL